MAKINIPITPKSESPNVVPAKPTSPNKTNKTTGMKLIMSPLANDPNIAPRRPPVAFPNTPAAVPVKKCGIKIEKLGFFVTQEKHPLL